jgi:hypothetical protein
MLTDLIILIGIGGGVLHTGTITVSGIINALK